MKQVMMVKFDSPKWRKVDEYKVANPFIDVGFREVKDVVDLRVFDLLNISCTGNPAPHKQCVWEKSQQQICRSAGNYNSNQGCQYRW